MATINDGSCTYPTTNVTLNMFIEKLSDTMHETSGLIFYKNSFWTLNDGGNPAEFYQFNSKGYITKKCVLRNGKNSDWEDFTQDDSFFYLADFGNNSGNRKDLCFYKIKKDEVSANQGIDTVNFQKINFTLTDQVSFNNQNQEHNFDFEACFVYNNQLHLFSKNWLDYKTRHYICPTKPGAYQLDVLETLDCNGLITGASISKNRIVALCGYDLKQFKTFVLLNWDFDSMKLSTGNRRQLYTGTSAQPGQTEAICFLNNQLYISNEKYINNAQLHQMSFKNFINDSFLSQTRISIQKPPFNAFINQNWLKLDFSEDDSAEIEIFNSKMQRILKQEKKSSRMDIDLSHLNRGYYIIVYKNQYSYGFILRN
jgi:hypothetical protein